jgi:hypothetical protein
MELSSRQGVSLVAVAFSALVTQMPTSFAQNTPAPKIDPMVVPDINVQNEDYPQARMRFHTKLVQEGPAPHQQECTPSKPPTDVVGYPARRGHQVCCGRAV